MFSPKAVSMSTSSSPNIGNISISERSFTSASARAMAAAAARRRSSGIFQQSSKRSSLSTPGKSIGRSLHTSHIDSGQQYIVDSYGATLPALVMEALTYADHRTTELSAVLANSGWAWLVAGRRVLIWRYRVEGARRITNHQFRELMLPPSDLAHRAQLVAVFSQTEGQVPSCVAVSPEGYVRHWPNIIHEGSYFEVSTELQGQECESLIFLGPSLGCLLATTTSTILQVLPSSGGSPAAVAAGAHITVRHLKAPAGILGGISRRVSSLVFGSMPTQAPEARLVGVVTLENEDDDSKSILVLSARSLQHWILEPRRPESLLYECNVEKFIHEAFIDQFWGRERVGGGQLHVWLVALQALPNENSIMILTAAVNPQVSQQLVYALVTLVVKGPTPPTGISSFCMLKHSEYYQESDEALILSQKFLLCGSIAFIYNKNSVLCVSASSGSDDSGDRVEFTGAGDGILGAGRCQKYPMFFSANKGIVSIMNSSNLNQSTIINESVMEDSMDLTNFTCLESSSSVTDCCSRLQAAFLSYNKKNILQAQAILEETFPSGESNISNTLDQAVIQLSSRLLDDIPASDPRWAEVDQDPAMSSSTSSVTSLILINQINDKIIAHQYFTSFLDQTGLSQRCGIGSVDDHPIQTSVLLAEHSEKLKFASVIRSLHSEHQDLVDSAIKAVINERKEAPTGRLSHSDVFYRKISRIGSIVSGLIEAQEEVLSADVSPRDAAMTIFNVNSLLLSLLKAAKCYESRIEYVPWSSTEGPRGIRSLLSKQHETTVQIGLTRAEDSSVRNRLYTQVVDLTDVVLNGFQPQISSLVHTSHPKLQTLLEDYQRLRYSLIQPLVLGEQYNEAVSLAEKFCDFRTLVEVCDKTDNQERLNQYMTQFGSQGFSNFVFRWYLETGKRGKLLTHGNSDSSRKDLTKFLQDYSSLAWLHQIGSKDFESAYSTLKHLASEEVTYLSRKKTLLSLSKLCSLASGGPSPKEKDIDPTLIHEDDFVTYQEQLPEPVLSAHSICPETMRVFSPEELIYLYIGEENIYANQFDYKKALDLLNWVDAEDDIRNLRRLIWARAALKTHWQDMDLDDPVEDIKDTVFFRTAELAFTQGCDLSELLVPVEDLLEAEELVQYKQDASIQFLIKASYEKINELVF